MPTLLCLNMKEIFTRFMLKQEKKKTEKRKTKYPD